MPFCAAQSVPLRSPFKKGLAVRLQRELNWQLQAQGPQGPPQLSVHRRALCWKSGADHRHFYLVQVPLVGPLLWTFPLGSCGLGQVCRLPALPSSSPFFYESRICLVTTLCSLSLLDFKGRILKQRLKLLTLVQCLLREGPDTMSLLVAKN